MSILYYKFCQTCVQLCCTKPHRDLEQGHVNHRGNPGIHDHHEYMQSAYRGKTNWFDTQVLIIKYVSNIGYSIITKGWRRRRRRSEDHGSMRHDSQWVLFFLHGNIHHDLHPWPTVPSLWSAFSSPASPTYMTCPPSLLHPAILLFSMPYSKKRRDKDTLELPGTT